MTRIKYLAGLILACSTVVVQAQDERQRTEIDESTSSRSIVDAFSRQITVQPHGNPQQVSVSAPINFEFGSAQLTPQGMALLDVIAVALNDPALIANTFVVEGHTDAVGSADSNLALSKRRAASVVSYLVSRSVAPGRLTAAGYGEYRLLAGLDPNDGRNRRVELVKE